MNTYSALYYPFLTVRNEGLLKHALLYWDHLDVIDPFNLKKLPSDEKLKEAAALVLNPHCPSDDEKLRAHNQIVELLDGDLPAWFFSNGQDTHKCLGGIYSAKFMHETWHELEKRKLVRRFVSRFPAYTGSDALGLIMMSILADSCASYTKATVTDESAAYDSIFKTLAVEVGARQTRMQFVAQKARVKFLTTAPLLTPHLSKIPLKNLVNLRKRERRTSGHHYTLLRHQFYDRLTMWSEALANIQLRASDQAELLRQYEQELNRDFSALREELSVTGRGFVLSTEMGAIVASVGGAIMTGGWAAPALAISSTALLANLHDKYRTARFKALYGHFSSYVYLAKQRRFEQDVI